MGLEVAIGVGLGGGGGGVVGDIFSTQLAYHRSNVAMERYF